MGTRSTTQIRIGDVPLITIYRQYDGYLDEHGCDLLALLKRDHVNGLKADRTGCYNGANNFAAVLVASLMSRSNKSGLIECGGIYIKDNSTHGQEEFTYSIDFELPDYVSKPKPPTICVKAHGFLKEGMTVEEFEKLVADGLPEDDE